LEYANAEGERVLHPGDYEVITISQSTDLEQANAEGERVLHPGDYEVIFSDGSAEVSAGLLTVSGAPTVVEPSAFRRGAGQQPSPVAEVA